MKTGLKLLAGAIASAAILSGGFYWHVEHSFSLAIRLKSEHACHGMRPCVLTLGQILPGDWDQVAVFDMAASQTEIDAAVGEGIRKPDLQRLIVFLHKGKVIRTVSETQGFEHPELSEIYFEVAPVVQNHFFIGRDTWLVKESGAPYCDDCTTLGVIPLGMRVQ